MLISQRLQKDCHCDPTATKLAELPVQTPRAFSESQSIEVLDFLQSRTHLAAQALYSALSNLSCFLTLLTHFPINLIYP